MSCLILGRVFIFSNNIQKNNVTWGGSCALARARSSLCYIVSPERACVSAQDPPPVAKKYVSSSTCERKKSRVGEDLARSCPCHIFQRDGDNRLKNAFGRKIRRNSPLCGGIAFASPEVVHRPKSDSPQHFDIRNIFQIGTEKLLVRGKCGKRWRFIR